VLPERGGYTARYPGDGYRERGGNTVRFLGEGYRERGYMEIPRRGIQGGGGIQ